MALTSYLISLAMQFFTHVTNDYGLDLIPVGIKGFFLSTNWYVYELIGFYLLFAVSDLLKKPLYRVVFVFICSIIGFVVLFNSGLVEAYYNSIFGFSAGMLLGLCDYTKILEEKKHGYILGIVILLVAFGLMFVMDKNSLAFALVRNIAAIGAVIVLIYLCSYVNIENKINNYLCTISPELYFYHMPLALILSKIINNPYKYMIVVIVLSMIFAIIFNYLDRKVDKFWKDITLKGE
jgi:peptidoglycan/LPS O-acetylase OafA/YrhL